MSFPSKTFIQTVPTKTVLPTHPFLAQLILLSNSIKKVVLYNISYQKTLVQKSYCNLQFYFFPILLKIAKYNQKNNQYTLHLDSPVNISYFSLSPTTYFLLTHLKVAVIFHLCQMYSLKTLNLLL